MKRFLLGRWVYDGYNGALTGLALLNGGYAAYNWFSGGGEVFGPTAVAMATFAYANSRFVEAQFLGHRHGPGER